MYYTIQTANNKGADQTAWMCRLICTFVVRKWWKQVFSWHGSFWYPYCLIANRNISRSTATLLSIGSVNICNGRLGHFIRKLWHYLSAVKAKLYHLRFYYQSLNKTFFFEPINKDSNFEPHHEKTCLWWFATRQDSDWPAHLQKLDWVLKYWI